MFVRTSQDHSRTAERRTIQCSRKNIQRLSTACSFALTSLFLLAGCGGGSSTSVTAPSVISPSSSLAGSYQGGYDNSGGAYAPDSGTITVNITASGAVTTSQVQDHGAGPTVTTSGVSVSNDGTLTGNLTGTLTQNSATHVFSAAFTQYVGQAVTSGALSVGLAPIASPLAGVYSGTYSGSDPDLGSGTAALSVGPTGVVTGTVTRPDVRTGGDTSQLAGFVDANGTIYLSYDAAYGGVGTYPRNAVGSLALTGASLMGTVPVTGTGRSGIAGSNNFIGTLTLTLTKQ